MGPNQFARAWKESLQATDPERYETLRTSGELERMAVEKGQRAADQFEGLMIHFRKEEGVPAGHFEAVQTLRGMESRANEIVLDELLEKQEA